MIQMKKLPVLMIVFDRPETAKRFFLNPDDDRDLPFHDGNGPVRRYFAEEVFSNSR